MRPRRGVLLVAAVLVGSGVACGGSTSSQEGARDDAFAASDFPEDTVLPSVGGWLDPPKALAGIGQFDRLRGTIHDDSKCSTMVALAAAVIGGRDRFVTFLDAVARLRAGHADDLAIVDRVRLAATQVKLTPRLLHELTEVVVRAYKVENGAYDATISQMVRASGYVAEHVGSSRPSVLADSLGDGEVVPIATIADNEAHITLLWKDTRGTIRLYDSDDIHGSHVLARGSALYRVRMDDPRSEWVPGSKYR